MTQDKHVLPGVFIDKEVFQCYCREGKQEGYRMFKVVIELKDVGTHADFVSAFKEFYQGIKAMMARGSTWQMLETACCIIYSADDVQIPMGFYDARDFAYAVGLLSGKGELQEVEAPPSEVVVEAFRQIAVNEVAGMFSHLLEVLSEVGQAVGDAATGLASPSESEGL